MKKPWFFRYTLSRTVPTNLGNLYCGQSRGIRRKGTTQRNASWTMHEMVLYGGTRTRLPAVLVVIIRDSAPFPVLHNRELVLPTGPLGSGNKKQHNIFVWDAYGDSWRYNC
jgi:hypothetical protein